MTTLDLTVTLSTALSASLTLSSQLSPSATLSTSASATATLSTSVSATTPMLVTTGESAGVALWAISQSTDTTYSLESDGALAGAVMGLAADGTYVLDETTSATPAAVFTHTSSEAILFIGGQPVPLRNLSLNLLLDPA